jgi:hypothetical protein
MTNSEARYGGLNLDRLKAIPLLQVLHDYGLIDKMFERGSTASGISPFSHGGVLLADLKLNVWSDSKGRPVIGGQVVAGDVVGLVQAIEGVGPRRALEILHERFVLGIRRCAASALASDVNWPFVEQLEGLIADVPYLRHMGVPPAVAEAWGVGWCGSGPMGGRIVFPVRGPDGTLVGYAGLDPKDPERWRLTEGVDPSRELFGIERIHRNVRVKVAAIEHGVTLASDPLEAVRIAQQMSLAVVAPLRPGLGREEIMRMMGDLLKDTPGEFPQAAGSHVG